MALPGVVHSYLEAYDSMDVAALVNCVSDTVVFENVSNAGQSIRIEGREAFAELAGRAATTLECRKQTVRTAIVDGGNVALDIDWTGTPAVDLGSMRAGAEISMRGASFITITDGKLARIVDLS